MWAFFWGLFQAVFKGVCLVFLKINLGLWFVLLHHNYFFFLSFFSPLFSAILNEEGWVTQPKYIWKYSCRHKQVIYYIGIYNSFWPWMYSSMRFIQWIHEYCFGICSVGTFFAVLSWMYLNTKAKTVAQGAKSTNDFLKMLLLWVDSSLKTHMPCFG